MLSHAASSCISWQCCGVCYCRQPNHMQAEWLLGVLTATPRSCVKIPTPYKIKTFDRIGISSTQLVKSAIYVPKPNLTTLGQLWLLGEASADIDFGLLQQCTSVQTADCRKRRGQGHVNGLLFNTTVFKKATMYNAKVQGQHIQGQQCWPQGQG